MVWLPQCIPNIFDVHVIELHHWTGRALQQLSVVRVESLWRNMPPRHHPDFPTHIPDIFTHPTYIHTPLGYLHTYKHTHTTYSHHTHTHTHHTYTIHNTYFKLLQCAIGVVCVCARVLRYMMRIFFIYQIKLSWTSNMYFTLRKPTLGYSWLFVRQTAFA